jgi:hypothetical protein
MSAGRHSFKFSDLRRALRAIEATGIKAKVILERNKMTVVPIGEGDDTIAREELEPLVK